MTIHYLRWFNKRDVRYYIKNIHKSWAKILN